MIPAGIPGFFMQTDGQQGQAGSGSQGDCVNPSAITIEQAAAMLRITPECVRGHVAAGLPTDPVGRIHLVEYAAWLVRRLGERK